MAEEAQVPECNGNEKPEIISVQVTDVIDENGSSIKCKTSQGDSGFTSGSPDILLEDKMNIPALDVNDKNEEDRWSPNCGPLAENYETSALDVVDDLNFVCLSSSYLALETDGDAAPLSCSEDISKQDKGQDGDTPETPDILLYQHSHHPSEAGTEDNLTETEEENTSIETDTEYGDGPYDEQDNGPQQALAISPSGRHLEPNEMAGSRPDISRISYSKYDTVSYRKIRKGNTKQRIDEFESMMNL